MTEPTRPGTRHIRARVDDLMAEVAQMTPMAAISNPNHIRDLVLRQLQLMAEMAQQIEALTPYVDEAPDIATLTGAAHV